MNARREEHKDAKPGSRPRTVTSWLVYPPNYRPGDGFHKRRFFRDAGRLALSLGSGSWLCAVTVRYTKGGCRMWSMKHRYTIS